jgi:non-ribosomal peptide synthetase component F
MPGASQGHALSLTIHLPDAFRGTAVICKDSSLNYAELVALSDKIAAALRNRGIEAGKLVGVCMQRGGNLVPVVLGILKAGAAYVPLDPEFPDSRLQYMVKDAELALIVADNKNSFLEGASLLTEVVQFVDLESSAEVEVFVPNKDASGDRLAYFAFPLASIRQAFNLPHDESFCPAAAYNYLKSILEFASN